MSVIAIPSYSSSTEVPIAINAKITDRLEVGGALLIGGERTAYTHAAQAPGVSALFTDTNGRLNLKANSNTASIVSFSTNTSSSGNAPTFASEVLTATGNQLALQPGGGLGTQYTFNAASNPVSNVTVNLQDPGQASVNLTTNAQPSITLTGTANVNITTHPGALLAIDASGGAVALTLPNVATAKGFKYRFWWKASGTTSTITGAATSIYNGVIINAGTSVLLAVNNKNILSFISGTATLGDYAEFTSDGTHWQILAVTSANGGITFGGS